MSTWFKLLPIELSGINESDFIEPDYEKGESDQLVGDMSDTARRLYTLAQVLEKHANQYKLDFEFCTDKVKKLELEARAHELMAKSSITRGLMWIGIRDEFGLWVDYVGVRTGFVVVTYPSTDDNISPIIRKLFGG